ncbi:MAG: phosphoribosylaminoimidazolesuccinocarboxamide synthase, partial [Patescibacteria group bacterium]|nr:phosphoribosylaminoimidazolesuccinocarboxamide synthase [Patescibacteria group bacterium]
QLSKTEFLAVNCKMIMLEIIIRRYAVGSYLDRYPNFGKEEGEFPYRFHRLAFELFLNTTGGKILTQDGKESGIMPSDPISGRPIDDPFISNPDEEVWELKHPKIPGWDKKSDLNRLVFQNDILPEGVTVEKIEEIARKVFLVLEGAWAQFGFRLIDFKIELGIDKDGNLLVADVIDNDSWRLRTNDWKELSKQLFRDNFNIGEIADRYALVAGLVKRFTVPRQAIVLWRGSKDDKLPKVPELTGIERIDIIKSGHKYQGACLNVLENVLASYPEGGVILAIVGMSNGLGPLLSARTSWPVIGITTTTEVCPEDVWSSLRMPSQVPIVTVLSPKNAILAALNILAQKNPVAYMHRQSAIEELDK